jgi:two-component system response regulator DevR
MKRIKVFLVDDHAVVRLGLMTLLEDIPWVDIAGEAGTAAEAVRVVGELRPDVVLMDIRLPDESGIVACATITRRWPETKVIMLTSYADNNLIKQAQLAGACSYIPKVVGNQPLIEELERLREEELALDPTATEERLTQYHQQLRERSSNKFSELSEREMRVLRGLSDGKTNTQIGEELGVDEKSVRNDIKNIVRKLGVDNRFEAAIYATRNKIQFYLPERPD